MRALDEIEISLHVSFEKAGIILTVKYHAKISVLNLRKYLTVNEPRHDKSNKVSVRPAKTQISLGIRPSWSEYSLCAQWVAKDPSFLHADSEDSDQTWRMPRLIWFFAGRTLTLLVLSCRGSNIDCNSRPWLLIDLSNIQQLWTCEETELNLIAVTYTDTIFENLN